VYQAIRGWRKFPTLTGQSGTQRARRLRPRTVVSASARSASRADRRHLPDDLRFSADWTGPLDTREQAGFRLRQHPRRHGSILPVPHQARSTLSCRPASGGRCQLQEPRRRRLRAAVSSTSNTPPDSRPRRPRSCYLYFINLPDPGRYHQHGGSSPPSDTNDQALTCGYVMGQGTRSGFL
jgi:hypothetical protein